MRFDPELPLAIPPQRSTAVLLLNLGTPDAPTARAVGRYLREFLSDPRVVEIPAVIWRPILHLAIVPRRARVSAGKYAKVWLPQGSPLRVYTERQSTGLQALLDASGYRVVVDHAMRYGQPAVGAVLTRLKRAGIERVLLLPLYPQYSASTSATAFDAAFAALARMRDSLEIRTLKDYCTHPSYLSALASQVLDYWSVHGRPDFGAGERLVLSFHGVPKRTIALGDPYHDQCQRTGAALMRSLGLNEMECKVTFQSRFGPAEWLQPYTAPTLAELGAAGTARVDVFCPGFTADCLETIEEIGMEGEHLFKQAGGKAYHRIPCLNDSPAWIHALGEIAAQHLQGWPVHAGEDAAVAAQQAAETRGAA